MDGVTTEGGGGARRGARLPTGAVALGLIGWTVLLALLAAVVTAAAIAGPRALVYGEGTYLMQAESLAFDADLAYTRSDFDRFLARHRASPPDLALASAGGARIVFDRPPAYALVLAPFVRAAPRHGFAVANALLLALATVVAAVALRRAAGPAAALWIALMAFASVTFGYVFLATGDLFLLTVAVLVAALLTDRAAGPAAWVAAGALLTVPAATETIYAVLPLALLIFAERGRRGALLLGLALGAAAHAGVAMWFGGGLPGVGLSRFTFTPSTGFPLVDFPAQDWEPTVHRLRALALADGPWRGGDLGLLRHNAGYLLLGRSIGLLPYFAPLLLLLPFGARGGRRNAWLLAAGLWTVAVLLLDPFDLFGGPGAIANRLFLPIYGALWLVIGRRRGTVASVATAAAVTLLAAPFLLPLWRAPWHAPIDPDAGYRHVSPVAQRHLPYETSQRFLPGGATVELQRLWVQPLTEQVWTEPQRGRLVLEAGGRGDLMVASPRRLDALRLDFGPAAPSAIEIEGGRPAERLLRPDGGIGFRVDLGAATAVHPLWWTTTPQHLYRLAFRFPKPSGEPLPFELIGERVEEAAP